MCALFAEDPIFARAVARLARWRRGFAGAGGRLARAKVGAMSRIAPSDVAHVAALARLALADDEATAMASHLEKILDHVAALDAVETEGVEPTLHGFDLPTPSRPDVAGPPLDPELAVANAPASEGSAFLVPKVLEEEG